MEPQLKFSKKNWTKIVGVGVGERWLCIWYMVVLYGSDGRMRKYMWAPEQKFGEIWMENGAVDGDVAARGRMSGLDGRMSGLSGRMSGLWIRTNSVWKVANPGKIRRNLWMEIGEKWMES